MRNRKIEKTRTKKKNAGRTSGPFVRRANVRQPLSALVGPFCRVVNASKWFKEPDRQTIQLNCGILNNAVEHASRCARRRASPAVVGVGPHVSSEARINLGRWDDAPEPRARRAHSKRQSSGPPPALRQATALAALELDAIHAGSVGVQQQHASGLITLTSRREQLRRLRRTSAAQVGPAPSARPVPVAPPSNAC